MVCHMLGRNYVIGQLAKFDVLVPSAAHSSGYTMELDPSSLVRLVYLGLTAGIDTP